MSKGPLYVGIDVGTGSVRAGLYTASGTLLGQSTKETKTWRSESDHRVFEQSTTDIWEAICHCVKESLAVAGASKDDVAGIGFDATCSLAVTDDEGEPICVTEGKGCGESGERNIVLWADHRAEEEAELINSTGSIVLDYVGGTMSLEMEIPKILWLKKHMTPQNFHRCQFFDLPDYLTYRATNSTTRSSCSLVCKCSFLPQSGWQPDFFEKIGLGELVEGRYKQIGEGEVLTAGKPVGKGLVEGAAEQLGLNVGTPVGSAVIDAYAGWIGTIGAQSRHRLAAVAGTSTCHLVQSPNAVSVTGVWGPYRDAIFPGWWMNEGGQSSTGQLIDFMMKTHPAYQKLLQTSKAANISPFDWLENELKRQKEEKNVASLTELTKDLHIYPDLHGNRSPIADPKMRGSIMGLALDDNLSDLAKKINVTLEAIALQTRHIVDEMNSRGHSISEIYMSGGQAKNKPLMQLFADVCSVPVILPFSHSTAVVLGSAMLGRYAAELTGAKAGELSKERLWEIMVEMTPPGTVVTPSASQKENRLLGAKYKIFRESIDIQKRWREEMERAAQE
ncbi:Pentulose kinase [Sistotremastrum niveocremeum HHB9708]|uniref:Pentulose kinase n=1 Tax=Sistotremastrum niveocremeum HHB9708 TaxID=1314777 RepID=A0A164TTA5_9AGAM|nr:Pentulose kinase [Sistotremastrum niveocremeum HHB9708]